MRIYRKSNIISLVILIMLLLSSCGNKVPDGAETYKVFFPDAEYTSLMSEDRTIVSGNNADALGVLIGMLSESPSEKSGVASLSGKLSLKDYSLSEDRLVLDFSGEYMELDKTKEILVRAAVVETLIQLPEVRHIAFLVDGREFQDEDGTIVGDMTEDSFINNTGEELNSYARTNVTLYFTDINGNGLQRYDEDVVYTSNMSMEKLALETLINGPSGVDEQGAFPTLSSDAKLLSVTVKDRIAYANFDASIREEPYNVHEEVAFYSIVNTLTALPGVDQVQVSIDGSTEGVFMNSINLDALYERNDELIR